MTRSSMPSCHMVLPRLRRFLHPSRRRGDLSSESDFATSLTLVMTVSGSHRRRGLLDFRELRIDIENFRVSHVDEP